MVHKYEEYAVKNVYNLVRTSKALQEYLPTEEMENKRYPDRAWFWGICFATIPDWANEYH